VLGVQVVAKKARETYQRPPQSVVLSLISAENASGILTNGGTAECECRTCCTQPFHIHRYDTQRCLFVFAVTQDITYHNAEINAADGA